MGDGRQAREGQCGVLAFKGLGMSIALCFKTQQKFQIKYSPNFDICRLMKTLSYKHTSSHE